MQLHLLEDRAMKAIQLFIRDWEENQAVHSRQRAEECRLDGLWQNLSFGSVSPAEYENSDLGVLLQTADEIKSKSGGKLSKHTEEKVCPDTNN